MARKIALVIVLLVGTMVSSSAQFFPPMGHVAGVVASCLPITITSGVSLPINITSGVSLPILIRC